MSRFAFQRIFQENSFSLSMQATLDKMLQGQHATVLAYACTKTYTMLGGESKEEEGSFTRCIRALLEGDIKVTLVLSVIQIYQEVVTGLLNPETKVLTVREGLADARRPGGS